jgi:hypothetical protein
LTDRADKRFIGNFILGNFKKETDELINPSVSFLRSWSLMILVLSHKAKAGLSLNTRV